MTRTSRRHRKKEATRQEIIRVAHRLFENQGLGTTTMEQIAAAADIAKATLYNYFTSKDAVAVAYMQDGMQRFLSEVENIIRTSSTTRKRLLALFGITARWLESHRDLSAAYFRHTFLDAARRGLEHRQEGGFALLLTRVIRAGQESGELRQDLDPTLMAAHLESMYFLVVLRWLADPSCCPLQDGAQTLCDLFLDGSMEVKKLEV